MSTAKLIVEGFSVAIETIGAADFISLTDIAKHESKSGGTAKDLIAAWLRNGSTLLFLETWEKLHNPNFKGDQMVAFKAESLDQRVRITPQRYVEATGAMGIISKSGRYGGGTWAHSDIALQFCYWLSPPFQVYLSKEFQRLKKDEFARQNLEWHIERITDLVDEARNWLDTVPGQRPNRNRLLGLGEPDLPI